MKSFIQTFIHNLNPYTYYDHFNSGGSTGGSGGVRTPHLSWVSIPSLGTLPPRTLFITNVKCHT